MDISLVKFALAKRFPAEAIKTLAGRELTIEALTMLIKNDIFGGVILCYGPEDGTTTSGKKIKTEAKKDPAVTCNYYRAVRDCAAGKLFLDGMVAAHQIDALVLPSSAEHAAQKLFHLDNLIDLDTSFILKWPKLIAVLSVDKTMADEKPMLEWLPSSKSDGSLKFMLGEAMRDKMLRFKPPSEMLMQTFPHPLVVKIESNRQVTRFIAFDLADEWLKGGQIALPVGGDFHHPLVSHGWVRFRRNAKFKGHVLKVLHAIVFCPGFVVSEEAQVSHSNPEALQRCLSGKVLGKEPNVAPKGGEGPLLAVFILFHPAAKRCVYHVWNAYSPIEFRSVGPDEYQAICDMSKTDKSMDEQAFEIGKEMAGFTELKDAEGMPGGNATFLNLAALTVGQKELDGKVKEPFLAKLSKVDHDLAGQPNVALPWSGRNPNTQFDALDEAFAEYTANNPSVLAAGAAAAARLRAEESKVKRLEQEAMQKKAEEVEREKREADAAAKAQAKAEVRAKAAEAKAKAAEESNCRRARRRCSSQREGSPHSGGSV